jgi:hypothetical protein
MHLQAGDGGDAVEVGVVAEHAQAAGLSGGGDEEVADRVAALCFAASNRCTGALCEGGRWSSRPAQGPRSDDPTRRRSLARCCSRVDCGLEWRLIEAREHETPCRSVSSLVFDVHFSRAGWR